MPTFEFTVDDEPLSTSEHILTPTQILKLAELDPATHYLIELKGNTRESFKDRPDTEIHMHPHLRFISVHNGPTPVS